MNKKTGNQDEVAVGGLSLDYRIQSAFHFGIRRMSMDNVHVWSLPYALWGMQHSHDSRDEFRAAVDSLGLDFDALMQRVDHYLSRARPVGVAPAQHLGIMMTLSPDMLRLWQALGRSEGDADRPRGVMDFIRKAWALQLFPLVDIHGVSEELSNRGDVVLELDADDQEGRGNHGVDPQPEVDGGDGIMDLRVLHMIGEDMMQLYEDGKIDPVIGRDREIDDLMESLLRWKKGAPILVGDPGVGKTAIVEGLVRRIAEGNVPDSMKKMRVWSITAGALSSGTSMKGSFEQRVQDLIMDLEAYSDRLVLFVDEIHGLFGSGSPSDVMSNPASMMKPALARGRMRMIGSTTDADMSKMVQRDPALMRRFQSIAVTEMGADDSVRIATGLRESYERHHGIILDEGLIPEAQRLAERYLSDRPNPDRILDVIDSGMAKARFRGGDALSFPDMVAAVSSMAKVPIEAQGGDGLSGLMAAVSGSVIGQESAVASIVASVRRHRVGLSDPSRPSGVFLLAGPTGVGKTELAKAIARHAFGGEDALIRFDMSEFREPHQVSRLIGSPPGYVGSQEGGALVEAVRKRPHAVLLLDEFEKADSRIFDLFLQVFDDARITDGLGRTASFRDVLILMTSNIGAKAAGTMGFGVRDQGAEARHADTRKAIEGAFRPEFINRFDGILYFDPIDAGQMNAIVSVELDKRARMLAHARRLDLVVDEAARGYLASAGYNAKYGVRPLRRLVETEIIARISDALVDGALVDGDRVVVGYNGEHITVTKGDVGAVAS